MGGGVGVAVRASVANSVKLFTFAEQQYDEALWLVVPAQRGARKLFIGVVYMPDEGKPAALKRAAYTALQEDLAFLSRNGSLIVMGDFNARIGRAASPSARFGMYGEAGTNSNGPLLLSLLDSLNMYALNARSPPACPRQHLTLIRSKGCSLIDYIIASSDIALPCQFAARPTAQVGPRTVAATDHLPVFARFNRRMPRRPAKQVVLRLNAQPKDFRLQNGEQSAELEAYQAALSQLGNVYTATISTLQQQVAATQLTATAAVQQAHEQLLAAIRHAVNASFGYKQVLVGKSFPWWSQQLTNAVQARVQAFEQYRMTGLVADWAAYQQQRRAAAQLIKAAKKQHKQQCEHAVTAAYSARINDDSVLGEKDMWQLIRRLCPKHVSDAVFSVIQHPSGHVASTPAEKADAFKCHYQRVGSHAAFASSNPQFDAAYASQVTASVQQCLSDSHSSAPCPLDSAITADEIHDCLHRLRTGKAGNPAEEGIVNELLKYGGSTVADMLLQYCSLMWQLEQVHQVPGTVVNMPKKGDLTDPTNYRGITLLSVLYKFYTSVLNQRLIKFAEGELQPQRHSQQTGQQQQRSAPQPAAQQPQQQQQQQQQQSQQQQPAGPPRATAAATAAAPLLHESQNGFRPKRSCADHQSVLSEILCGRKAEGKESYVLFVDTYKAFPTVWLDGLFYKLWEKGVRGKMFRVLYNLYQGARRVVSHEGCVTESFSCDLGLHEGDVISPTLYLFFIDDLLREVHAKHPGITLLGPSDEAAGQVVAAMQADDFVAVCGSLSEVQAVAATVYEYSCKWRFKLNSSKSAVMHILPGRQRSQRSQLVDSGIIWNDVPVPVVSEYCYLGLWFNDACNWSTHFDKMLDKVQRVKAGLMPIWKSRHISVEVKRIVLLTCIRPVVEYGSEVWFPSTARQLQQIDQVQTDIIKCAMRCGKERPCSSAVLAEWGVKPLHMWLHQRAMEYYFRIQRMDDVRLPKQVFSAEWRRSSGAMVVTPWHKYVQSLLCKYGVNVETAAGRASCCKSHISGQIKKLHADRIMCESLEHSTLLSYITHVHPKHADAMTFKRVRPFLRSGSPTRGVELMMRVRLGCLAVHERTSRYGGRRADGNAACPACGAGVESLSHLLFDCAATSVQRDEMFNEIRALSGCAAKLRNLLSITDAEVKVKRFVSDDAWGSARLLVSRFIADFLEKAWGVRNACKHDGVVLLSVAAPLGRGADGVDAMA